MIKNKTLTCTCIRMLVFTFIFVAASGLYGGGGFSYQVDFNSRYIWRGWDLNPVHKPVVQPSVTYAFGDSGLAFNVWFNFSFEDKDLNEIDFTASYDFKTSENFSLSAGFINYGWWFVDDFKFKDHTSQEIYVTAGLPNVFFAPHVSVYYDFTLGDGLYADVAVSHSVKLGEKISADLSASLGYNAGQWLPEGVNGFSDLNFGIAVPFKAGKFTITPSAAYTIVLLDEIDGDNHLWFGISVSF